MIPFDPLRTPLEGIGLIEAAAGTGKTHTIEGLFIRLLVETRLTVEQILVVTFTRAATAELRDRIYRRLAKTRDVLDGARQATMNCSPTSRPCTPIRSRRAGCCARR